MTKFFANLLNRLSMYKVVSITLTVLFAAALLFSALGVLSYSPLAMLASVGVLGFSVFLISLLFGLIFGVRVHTESSFITAMILFFIFTPTLEVSGLVTLALVGFIAAASKFLLAFRGRHIFNPAAIAALVIGFTGLGFATWWVATPVLIPFTLLLGYAVIQKTRRVHMSGTFMVASVVLVAALLVSYGNSLGDALVLLLSWPIFYFSAFMLTEPLTMPPKKWQQVVEALVVAVLFSIPLHIGDLSLGPAFALVVGNLLAFIFARHQSLRLRFKRMKQLTPTSFEFAFTSKQRLNYEAGQYVELTIPHKKADLRGERRSFSITSAPGDTELTLGVKFYEPSSSYKSALKSLQYGGILSATGIQGDFTLPKEAAQPLLLIAGGIGITPYIGHLQQLKKTKEKRDIVLVYAVNDVAEIAYKDILVASGVKVIIVTKSGAGYALPSGWEVIEQPYITQEALEASIPDITTRSAYISGPPMLIDGTKRHLKHLGVKKIKTDYFIGY